MIPMPLAVVILSVNYRAAAKSFQPLRAMQAALDVSPESIPNR
ncbi:hypothetical protein BRCON_1893 [Candidatus Sumerlaea chitinivorans]|uniref:Uncharacterized protein n=1 Tax=Sumerlaea chitinivorans TaxID=2250252 RepID=A0A2Z4Y648_SUMC1|nr:hypothetical protein BRCON_1893 [Candidatus Sumerlaea chitinivorans]